MAYVVDITLLNIKPIARRIQWQASRWRRSVRRLEELPKDAGAVLVSIDHELPQAQIYPFHAYGAEIERAVGERIYEIDLQHLEAGATHVPMPQVHWVGFQAPLNCPIDALLTQVHLLKRLFPAAMLVYFDWYAPLDLRHAEALDPYIAHYVKKQTFADLGRYRAATVGDTNLMDYYAGRYGLHYGVTQHKFPSGFEGKLALGTNFCVSAGLLDRFLSGLPNRKRDIDVHARIAARGSDWYQTMRQESLDLARSVPGVRTVFEGRVSRARFFKELEQSKICFSPFGYGEVCWRDFEAIACGALLFKPRMDHVRVEPDIFVDGQTYVALEWDGSDYEEKVRHYLADAPARERITRQAYEVVETYLRERPFVGSVARLFVEPARQPLPEAATDELAAGATRIRA